jgi:hypothetical protein
VFGNTIAALLLYRVGGQHLTDAVDEAIAAKKS